MGAFVGNHGFQIHHMADDVIFIDDAVAAMHIAGEPRDIERLAGAVTLHQRDGFRRAGALIHHAA